VRFLFGAAVLVTGILVCYGAVTGYLPTMLAAFLAPSALVRK
jgi:hypothetical protein